MVRGEWKFFTVGGGVWRYNLVGYLDIWLDILDIFVSVGKGGWRYILDGCG